MNTDMQMDIYHYLVHECRLDTDEAWCTISDLEQDIENGEFDIEDIWEVLEDM